MSHKYDIMNMTVFIKNSKQTNKKTDSVLPWITQYLTLFSFGHQIQQSKYSNQVRTSCLLCNIPDGTTHWELYQDATYAENIRTPYPKAVSSSIEITSYVLLIDATMSDVHAGLDIIKWLVQQRNPFGGFGSTQV